MMRIDIISRNDADVVGVRNGCTFTGWTGRYWIEKKEHCFEDMQRIKRLLHQKKGLLATLSTYLDAPNLLSMS